MTRLCQSRLRAVMLAAIVAAGAGLCAQATTHRDCFEVTPYGDIRHMACTIDSLTDVHYAVDKFKTNDWEVVCHGGGNESRMGVWGSDPSVYALLYMIGCVFCERLFPAGAEMGAANPPRSRFLAMAMPSCAKSTSDGVVPYFYFLSLSAVRGTGLAAGLA